ncbi:MAG: ferredoxin family protein [Planctomycetota bacterium]|nr:ferredoxin family protein [Planctomycetota bacterium]
MTTAPHILLCTCRQAGLVAPDKAAALARGLNCTVVEDLCGLAATDPAALRLSVSQSSVVIACHARAVRWLLQFAGAPVAGLTFLNARVETAESLLDQLPRATGGAEPAIPTPPGWTPWFPVIDYDRCTGCGQCLEFCLFDVYAREGQTVQVARPSNCKTHCPACARVCPAGAVIFPKYAVAPFNGEPVPEGFQGGGGLACLARDPYAALRGRPRFSTDARDAAAALDIPADVLASPEAAALRARLNGDPCPCQRPDDESDDVEPLRGNP